MALNIKGKILNALPSWQINFLGPFLGYLHFAIFIIGVKGSGRFHDKLIVQCLTDCDGSICLKYLVKERVWLDAVTIDHEASS